MKVEGIKRINSKSLTFIALFLVIHAAGILVLSLTVMRIRTPKVRLDAVAVTRISSSTTTTTTTTTDAQSFGMTLNAEFQVKNTNFGHFDYDDSTLTLLYDGTPAGTALIHEGRVNARSTRRFNVTVDINVDQLAEKGSNYSETDMDSGVLRLTGQAKLSGKVHLMKIIKRKKAGDMWCTIGINLATRDVGVACL